MEDDVLDRSLNQESLVNRRGKTSPSSMVSESPRCRFPTQGPSCCSSGRLLSFGMLRNSPVVHIWEALWLSHAQEVAIATPRATPSAPSACAVGSHAIYDHSTVVRLYYTFKFRLEHIQFLNFKLRGSARYHRKTEWGMEDERRRRHRTLCVYSTTVQ